MDRILSLSCKMLCQRGMHARRHTHTDRQTDRLISYCTFYWMQTSINRFRYIIKRDWNCSALTTFDYCSDMPGSSWRWEDKWLKVRTANFSTARHMVGLFWCLIGKRVCFFSQSLKDFKSPSGMFMSIWQRTGDWEMHILIRFNTSAPWSLLFSWMH